MLPNKTEDSNQFHGKLHVVAQHQQGEEEQVFDPKDAETSTKEFKTEDSTSLEETKQVMSEPQSETSVKFPVSSIGKY